jgi:Rieske 2Fe-2S family protein
MGDLKAFDGGVSTFRCEPFIFLAALSDHAVMFRFSPQNAEESQVDIDRMTWLWDVTTKQDKVLIERNTAGIRSRSYVPGPYSKLESLPARFVSRYLAELHPST